MATPNSIRVSDGHTLGYLAQESPGLSNRLSEREASKPPPEAVVQKYYSKDTRDPQRCVILTMPNFAAYGAMIGRDGKVHTLSSPFRSADEDLGMVGIFGDDLTQPTPYSVEADSYLSFVATLLPEEAARSSGFPYSTVTVLQMEPPPHDGAGDPPGAERFNWPDEWGQATLTYMPLVLHLHPGQPHETGVPLRLPVFTDTMSQFEIWMAGMWYAHTYAGGRSLQHDENGLLRRADVERAEIANLMPLAQTIQVQMTPLDRIMHPELCELALSTFQGRARAAALERIANYRLEVPANPAPADNGSNNPPRRVTLDNTETDNKYKSTKYDSRNLAFLAAFCGKLVVKKDDAGKTISSELVCPFINQEMLEGFEIKNILAGSKIIQGHAKDVLGACEKVDSSRTNHIGLDEKFFDPAVLGALKSRNWSSDSVIRRAERLKEELNIFNFATPDVQSKSYIERQVHNTKVYLEDAVGEQEANSSKRLKDLPVSPSVLDKNSPLEILNNLNLLFMMM